MARVAKLNADLTMQSSSFDMKLENSRRMMRKAANDIGSKAQAIDHKVSTAFRNSARSIAIIEGPLGGVAGRLSAVAAQVTAAGWALGGMAVAVAGGAIALKKAADEGETFNRSHKKTEALLRATGEASALSARQIREMSREIALNTLASVDGVERAAQKLLTFKSVGGDTFKRTLELSQDLAELGFGSIEQAVVQLGKALEDPKIGLTSLTRVGISFTDSQKEMIKNLVETNRQAEAQKVILDILAKQVDGVSKAAAEGLAGAHDTLNQRMSELWQSIDKRIGAGEKYAAALNAIAGTVESLNERLDPDLVPTEKKIFNLRMELFRLQEQMKELGPAPAWNFGPLQGIRDLLSNGAERNTLAGQIAAVRAELERLEKQADDERLGDMSRKFGLAMRSTLTDRGNQLGLAGGAVASRFAKNLENIDKEREKSKEKLDDFLGGLSEQESALQRRDDALNGGASFREANLQMDIYIAQLKAGVSAESDAGRAIESHMRAIDQLNEAYAQQVDAQREIEQTRLEFEAMGEGAAASFARAIVAGESLLDVVKQLGIQLASRALTDFLYGAIFGPIFSGIGSGVAGARALGGPVIGGQDYLVGERGPEIFRAPVSGQIIPNNRLDQAGSGGMSGVSISVDARGADDPAAVEAAATRAILAAIPQISQIAEGRVLNRLSRPAGAF